MITRDVMIQLSDCAQISKEHSLQAAVIMLSAVRRRFNSAEFRPRFVLVYDEGHQIVGALREPEILKALAVKSEKSSLPAMIAMASRVTAGEAMVAYGEAQSVAANAPVEDAIDKLVSGNYHHLLVKDGGATVGIVRLSEIFSHITRNAFRTTQD
jgi:CBS-domain-containing membrane protein